MAGGLLAHWNHAVYSADYDFNTALVWVLMAVVGGLGSRAGIVVASAFFAVFPLLLPANAVNIPHWLQFIGVKQVSLAYLSPLIGAALLLFTVILYPGGIGQQLLPIRRWLAGGDFFEHRRRPSAEELTAQAVAPAGPGEISTEAPTEPIPGLGSAETRPPPPEPAPPPEPTPAPAPEPEPEPEPALEVSNGSLSVAEEPASELATVAAGDGSDGEDPDAPREAPRRKTLFSFRKRKGTAP